MSTATNQFRPDYAIHPGEYLEEVLEARGVHKNEFALRCGLTAKTVSQIVNRRVAFSPEAAIQFEKVLGISADIWMGLLSAYQLHETRRREIHELNDAREWAKQFPLRDLRKRGILKSTRISAECVRELLEFFGVSSPASWERVYGGKSIAYRKSPTVPGSFYAVATWLRIAETRAEERDTQPFDPGRLRDSLPTMRSLTARPPDEFGPEIVRLCAAAGVALVCVPEVAGARISGAAEWLSSNRAMVALSLRHKTDDHFWFTVFHEIGHVILHGKKRIFIDDDDEKADSQEESQANEFARRVLIPKQEYERLISRGPLYADDIEEFADRIRIAPGIVAGMLQHDGLIEYSWHNKLKRRLECDELDGVV